MHTCRTRTLIEEVPTDGHSPLKFLCDDGNLYYCKYRIRSNGAELDFLAYEVAEFQQPGQFKIVAEAPPVQSPQRKQFDMIKEVKRTIFSVITPQELGEEARIIASNGHSKASLILVEEK